MSLRAALEGLSPASRFRPAPAVDLAFDAHHPQGLARHGGLWWLSTADVAAERGYVLGFADDGALVHRVDVTDGPRFHPGGCDVRAGTLAVPVAEYRPWSSTAVQVVDLADLSTTTAFRFDDHLGAVAALPAGGYLAVTWAGRDLLRLSADGVVAERRANPSHFVDVQDVQVVDDDTVLATGVLTFFEGDRLAQLGGVALLDVDALAWRLEVPVAQWSPAGRALTCNPVHVELVDGVLHLLAVPDDGRSQLLRCAVTPGW